MMKRLIAALLAAVCLSALPFTVLGANWSPVTVVLPYYHVWKTDVPDADDRFTYRWTAETAGAPMPEGSTNSHWDWHLRGNTEGELSLVFPFEAPGTYSYRLAAYVPEPKEGYVYEPRTFLLTVLVSSGPDGAPVAEWYLLNEQEGTKTDRIDLDPSYTAPKDGKEDKPGHDDHPKDEKDSADSRKKKGESSHQGKQTSSGQSGSSTGSSNSVKTGDETRIESLLVIFCVSALLLAYLVYEELRERREKRMESPTTVGKH